MAALGVATLDFFETDFLCDPGEEWLSFKSIPEPSRDRLALVVRNEPSACPEESGDVV